MPITQPPSGSSTLYEVETGPSTRITWRRKGAAGLQLLALIVGLGVVVALLVGVIGLAVALVLSTALN